MAYDPNDPTRDPNARNTDPVSRTPPPAAPSRSNPLGFVLIAVVVVAAIAAFLMFRDNPNTSQVGMNNPPATQTTPNTTPRPAPATPPAAAPNNPGPTAPPAPTTPPANSQ